MALSGMDGSLSLVKNEVQATPAAVQRSSSLDSMQNTVAVLPGGNEMLSAPLPSVSNTNNSLSPPCQPVQRSRSLPLLDSNQGIPPEILADLASPERGGALLGNHSVGLEDGLATSQAGHEGVPFLQRDYLGPSQLAGLTQQPLNLSQSADVKQFLSPFQQPMVPRPNLMGRQVRNLIPHQGEWSGYQMGGRLPLRGAETTLAGLAAIPPPGVTQGQTLFNPSVANIYSKVMDKALGFSIGETFAYGRDNVAFPSGQAAMTMNPLRHQGVFEGKHSKDGERPLQLPKDGRGNLASGHQHHHENNNDKTSPNIQALSETVGSHLGDKSMLPLSVSVSVAFSEPSQDSPASLSRHSNSPAMPYRTSADQMLSMINYNDEQLLQEHGLMADNSVAGTLDDNFLGGSMGMGHPSGARLTDSSNLTGMDSNPPSVNNETFDLFDGSGDVEEANYMTDSLSPQPLTGNVDSDVHVSTSLSSMSSQSGSDVLSGLPRTVARGGFAVGGGKNPPENKATGLNSDGSSTDVTPRRKGRPPSRNPGHRYSQPCQVCSKIFGSSSALAKHKLIHSSERRHKCVLCAKSFKRQDHLAGHMLTHRSKKPYECVVPDCGKSYCDIRSLRRHFESQHNGLVMEDHMKYTGDEKDPELIAAEEAAVAQAQAQGQGHGSGGLPATSVSSYMGAVNALTSMPGMGGLTVNNFGPGLLQQPSQAQTGPTQQQQQQQQQQGSLSNSNQAADSPGSSSSAALQFLAQAAQRAQTSLPLSATSPNSQPEGQPMGAATAAGASGLNNPQLPQDGGGPTAAPLHRFSDLINPSGPGQLGSTSSSSSAWNVSSQYEPLSNARGLIMDGIPAPRLSTTMSALPGNQLTNSNSRRTLGSAPGMPVDVRQPSPRGPSPAKSEGKEKNHQPVECSVCRRVFKSMPALNGHMRLHGGYNNARGEAMEVNKVESSKPHGPPTQQPLQQQHHQPRQQVLTPPRPSQLRTTPETRVPQTRTPEARLPETRPQETRLSAPMGLQPTSLQIPNHNQPPPLPSMLSGQGNPIGPPLPQPPHQTSAGIHVSVPPPSFAMQMTTGLSQPSQMAPLQNLNLNQLRPQQLDLPAPVKRELTVPKLTNPFLTDSASFGHHPHQPTSYPQFMPVSISHVKDMPFPSSLNFPTGSPQAVQMMLKTEPAGGLLGDQRQPVSLPGGVSEHELGPPRLEAIKPPEEQNVFRNPPPPTQPSPTKKRPRPSPLHIPSCVSTGTPGGILPGTYQSQMRSPRELGGLYQHHSYRSAGTGTGTTPPPYTPPPMLSPIRSGPGLYFNVGPMPLPTMTPKTPSMISMHRKSTSTADEPTDFVFSSAEPHINVGPEFQAKIPDLLDEREEVPEPDGRLGWLAWDPSINDKYTLSEMSNFLMLSMSAALPGGARNTEYAHHCLQRADGDIELALNMLMNPLAHIEENHPFADYNYNFTSTWTPAERKTFRDHFKAKGKDFHAIQKALPTKSIKEIVEYYYCWKKLFPYNRDMQKFCHHSGSNPTEEMRRNECDLYPEETFIDYVPLKEYRHDKYYRGGGQTRNNNHVKTSSNQEEKAVANPGPFTCNYPDCAATFKSRQALNGHIRVHGGTYKSQPAAKEPAAPVRHSPSPASETTSTSGLSRRMSTDDSSSAESLEPDPVTFPCKICGKVFSKVKSRSAHMKSHRKVDGGRKLPPMSPEEESPPEFGTETINHYARDDSEDDNMEDDDMEEDEEEEEEAEEEEDDEEEEEEEDGFQDDERDDDATSSSGQSGSRSESSSESESESGHSDQDDSMAM